MQPVSNLRLGSVEVQESPSAIHPDGQHSTAVSPGAMAFIRILGRYWSTKTPLYSVAEVDVKAPLEDNEPMLSFVAIPTVVQALGHAMPGEK